jgi:hypothetical protein
MTTTDLLLAATLARSAQRQTFEPYSFQDARMLHRAGQVRRARRGKRRAAVRAAWFSARRLVAAQVAADGAPRPNADQAW